ncbi:MAG: hypothetical protein ABSG15_07075, partial [FCB group bacterium]
SLAKGNNKYYVMVPHTKEECLNVLDDFKGKGDLLKISDWGCMSGDHTAYFTVMAKNEDEVRNMLPDNEKDKAKIQKVSKFTAKQLADLHKKMDNK